MLAWLEGRGFTGFTIRMRIDIPLPPSSTTRTVECLAYSSFFFVLKRKIFFM